MRILVAEDNAINRELVKHILTQLGHTVVLAHTGREVLDKHAAQPCDLILMDLWMPDMDGLVACTHIREREGATGRRVPIIALTAHSVKGDRDACLAAGMNDYLTKPVRRDILVEAIRRAMDSSAAPGAAAPAPASPAKALLGPWEGVDAEILYKLAPMMVESTNTSITDLREALAAGDWQRLQREAHSLKGSLGLFHAPTVVGTAKRLEDAAKVRDAAQAKEVLETLASEVLAVQAEVRVRCA